MRVLLLFLIALAIALLLGIYLQDNPGRMVFSYGDIIVQTSFALFTITLAVLFIALYIVTRFIAGVFHLPERYRHWFRYRGFRRSEKYLTRGMLAMLEGNWRSAEEAFRKGAPYSAQPMINYLGAARAAQQQGAVQRRDHYLRLAHEHNGGNSLAVGLTQAELQLSHRQNEQAYATLKQLHNDHSNKNLVKTLLLKASTELQEWQQVLKLVPEMERSKLLPPEQLRTARLEAYAGLLRKAGERPDRSELLQEWNYMSGKLQREPYLIEVYITERLRFPDSRDCEPLLKQALKRQWDEKLVHLYGLVESDNPAKQLAFAEQTLAAHGGDATLLLTLGRLSMRNGLWGKAKSYLERSIASRPMPESYHELARLLESQGNHDAAFEYFQKGLNLVTDIPDIDTMKLLEEPEDTTVENPIVDAARRTV